jgi:hypothetical protein
MKTLRKLLSILGPLVVLGGLSPAVMAQGTQGPTANGTAVKGFPLLMGGSDGTNVRNLFMDSSGRVYVNVNGTVPVSGTFWQATQPVSGTFWQTTQPVSGTFWQATQPVSIAAALTLGAGSAVIGHIIADTGSTTAVTSLPALPAGTNVIGHVINDASSAVIGHVIADTGSTTAVTGNVTAVQATGSNLHVQVDTAPTTTVTGTVTANIGTTNGLALDTSVNGILLGQASTTSGQAGPLVQGSVTTSAPSYTTAKTSPLSLTTAGALRTDASATTQPISGTVTANAGSGTFAISASSLPLPTNAATDASVTGLQVSQGSTTSGQKGGLALGAVTTAAPAYTTTQSSPLSLDTTGNLRTSVNNTVTVGTHAVTQSGTWQNQITDGTTVANVGPASGAQTGQAYLQSGGTYREAASLSAGSLNADLIPSTDLSGYKWVSIQVTGIFVGVLTFQASNDNTNFVSIALTTSNSTNAGPTVSMSSGTGIWHGPFNYRYLRVRMTTYSSGTATGTAEYYTLPGGNNTVGAQTTAAQSGTWTVQPGNTANTTPWLVNALLNPSGTALNTYSVHLTSNTTTTPTASTAYISSISISSEVAGTTSTVTIQDKQGTPLKLVNGFSTTALTTTPTVVNFQTPVKMTSGIDIVTAGAVAATIDVWINYYQ